MARQERPEIIDVWRDNLDSELTFIRDLVDEYPFIGMDTEFPGVVARPIGTFRSPSDYHYQTLRCNVDQLRIIQLGLTLCDANGRRPEGTCTWQFNFQFSLNDDAYAPESIDLLQGSGLNFKQHEDHGIDMEYFGELLISSGLVLLDDVRWISFHSGYDFGYILKMVTMVAMPVGEADFFDLLKIWFPCVYDIKYIMRSAKSLRGGLNDVAKDLGVARHGTEHQAGSDSLLTADVFFALRSQFFDNTLEDSKYLGQIYGLGSGASRGTGDSRDPSNPSEDPLALTTEPLPSLAHPPGSAHRRQPPRGYGPPGGGIFGTGTMEPPAPRASSAVSIKNPNAPNPFTTATSITPAAGTDDTGSVFSAGRAGSPAVR